MAKEILRIGKTRFEAGQAKPGASLASFGVDMPKFCREFNDLTKGQSGKIGVKAVVFKDKTFKISLTGLSTTDLIKSVIGAKKEITKSELKKVAEKKLAWLNTEDLEVAEKIIAGSVKSAGFKIV